MPGLMHKLKNFNIGNRSKKHMDVIPPSPRQRLRYFRENEDVRRNTFSDNGWPSDYPVSKEDLLDDGFFFVGDSTDDRVQCCYCGKVFHGFKEGDDVHIQHYRHSPNCERFLEMDDYYKPLFLLSPEMNNGECDVVTDGPDENGDDDDLEVDCLQDHTVTDSTPGYSTRDALSKPTYKPRHKYYGTLKDRLKTFRKWPKGQLPDPHTLAKAGLFYTGTGDCCECFYCGGQLDEWEDGDIPQQEHDSNFETICPLAKKK